MSKIEGAADAVSKPSSVSNKDAPNAGSSSAKRATGDDGSKDSMDLATERISNVKLETSPFGEKVQPGKSKAAGPSLLSQQAPAHPPPIASSPSPIPPPSLSNPPPYEEREDSRSLGPIAPPSSSAMSVDNMPLLDGTEKITVKIADLGNGAFFLWVADACVYVSLTLT